MVVRLTILLLGAVLLLLAGCDTPCESACERLHETCGVEQVDGTVEDCGAWCESWLSHYDGEWQEDDAKAAVRCVASAPCSELREGIPCYSEAVYIW